jgi:hypothetical protein
VSKKESKKDPMGRVRKIGEREENVDVKLTQLQIEDLREQVMVYLDDEERIEEKAKEAQKNFASQLKTNQLQRNEIRRTIAAGRKRVSITVEEYLTNSNEVIRVHKQTGEQLGPARTATPRELQEELPLGDETDTADLEPVDADELADAGAGDLFLEKTP